MIQGTYYKEWSTVLGREMEFKVYGHAGVPVLALPARGGRFYEAVLFCLGQRRLVGNAVLLQIGKGSAAQHHVIAVGAPEAGQLVDTAHAHSTCKQGGTAQTAVDGVVSAQVYTGSPDPGALFGVVQGQNTGSKLCGQVDEILSRQKRTA